MYPRLFAFLTLCVLVAMPINAQQADSVYAHVPEPAQLLPSEEAALHALAAHMHYPREAAEQGISGMVVLRLEVNARGEVAEAVVVRSLGGGCDEAAVGAVKSLQFAPGRLDGLGVSTYVTLPVPCRPPSEPPTVPGPPAAVKCEGEEVLPTMIPNNDRGMRDLQARVVYPRGAKAKRVQGRVLVKFTLGTDGQPHDFEVVSPVLGHSLEESAVMAVMGARFRPRTCDGVPVETTMTMPITFRLH